MLCYDRIVVFEGIDINKTTASKDCAMSLLIFLKL